MRASNQRKAALAIEQMRLAKGLLESAKSNLESCSMGAQSLITQRMLVDLDKKLGHRIEVIQKQWGVLPAVQREEVLVSEEEV